MLQRAVRRAHSKTEKSSCFGPLLIQVLTWAVICQFEQQELESTYPIARDMVAEMQQFTCRTEKGRQRTRARRFGRRGLMWRTRHVDSGLRAQPPLVPGPRRAPQVVVRRVPSFPLVLERICSRFIHHAFPEGNLNSGARCRVAWASPGRERSQELVTSAGRVQLPALGKRPRVLLARGIPDFYQSLAVAPSLGAGHARPCASERADKYTHAAAPRDKCPPCFNCLLPAFTCGQYGDCNKYDGQCQCPPGWGGQDCLIPRTSCLRDRRTFPAALTAAQSATRLRTGRSAACARTARPASARTAGAA
jgi:hypothetical protein